MIRYHRARQSHCLHSRNWHVYLFPRTRARGGFDSGVTLKLRRRREKPQLWRHWSLRFRYRIRASGGRTLQLDLETHLATHFKRHRVLRSKRYLRLKACV